MDSAVLVNGQIEGGETRIREILAAGIDVTAAFWLKSNDDEHWYLYIASKDVDDQGATKVYRRAHAATSRHPIPWVDTFQLKVIGARDPLAEAVLTHRHDVLPNIYRQPFLANVPVEEAYIYPKTVTDGS